MYKNLKNKKREENNRIRQEKFMYVCALTANLR